VFYLQLLIVCAQDASESIGEGEEKVIYKLVPAVSSNPVSGMGFGVIGMGVYKADKYSSPLQAMLAAQYTNTDSYNVFFYK